jgi:flagellar basal-body rod protein FlgB
VVEIGRDFLTDVTSAALAKSLDCAGIRHRVIADNLANVETPGFKRSEVSFEAQLDLALKSGDEESAVDRIRELEPQIQEDATSPARPNGNNVSVDKEMAVMTKNNLQYESLVQLMNLRGSMIRNAIFEGRK